MQEADTVSPEVEWAIQRTLANESVTELIISGNDPPPPLTVTDARLIIGCLRENPRFVTLSFYNCPLGDAAVLNVFRHDLPLCTSITTVNLSHITLGNEGLEILLPAFYNTNVTSLKIANSNIGGEVIQDLLVGNKTLLALALNGNQIVGPEVTIALGRVLADKNKSNNFLTQHLDLGNNNIKGADGGRQVGLWLQLCRQLEILVLSNNNLGPLGARALAPGLAAARHLEVLDLSSCGLGNDGVANLIPDGLVNRTLTSLDLCANRIRGLVGGENVVALVSRCTNLDRIDVDDNTLSPDQQRRLDLLLDRKRLCTRASALAGSTFSVLFQFVEEAHRHEHGLSAILVILQDDGDDHFCNAANNRAI